MRLKRITIENFRSIQSVSVDVDRELAIVGANGSGKSTILRALERFFGQSTAVELDDFFGRRTDVEIEISLTFSDFSVEERSYFEKKIFNDEMTVVRVFEAGGGRTNGRYYGAALQHLEFKSIRDAEGAVPARAEYNRIRNLGGIYSTLPAVTRFDQIGPSLESWEGANPEHCHIGRDDGQFFGFTNVARGALNKFINFVFIPAVRDAAMDALDSRGAVIARLMELVVRSAVQQRKDVRAFQERVAEEYKVLTDPSKLTELIGLSDNLTETIRLFYGDASVALQWRPAEDFALPLPTADVFLDDDGFEGPVDKKGHGLQRAFILTLLQHLAKAFAADDREKERRQVEVEAASGAETGTEVEPSPEEEGSDPIPLPNLILAIEEPELYQHPTKQRHFAKVLEQLSSGELLGVARQTQVLFATHSSLFVSMDRFDDLALARRERREGYKHKCCKLTYSTLADVAERLEKAHDKPPGTFSADGLRARLHIIGAELSEGFFADMVVLVEGVSDRAAILAGAELQGVDLGARGIAVLYADGKSKLDRPLAIFSSLEIPTFVMWDCDKKAKEISDISSNRALQRLAGVPSLEVKDAFSTVQDNFACFETNLEDVLKAEIGEAAYLEHIEIVRKRFGIQKKEELEKAPFAMCELLKGLGVDGRRSGTLDKIVEVIVKRRDISF